MVIPGQMTTMGMQQAPPPMGQPMAQKRDPSQLKGKYVHLRPPQEQTTRANYSREKGSTLPGMTMLAETMGTDQFRT